MLDINEIKSISSWIHKKSKTLKYGTLTIEIKLSGNRPPLVKRSVSEQFLIDNDHLMVSDINSP